MKLNFKNNTTYVLIADFALIVCLFVVVINISTVSNRPEKLDLFEAFFRYKFENNYTRVKQNAGAYYLEIAGKDPSPEFMARFDGHSPLVKKGSEFVALRIFDFVDEESLEVGSEVESGILFQIHSCKWNGWGWITRNRVEIYGGFYQNFESASWASCIWVRKKGKWKLKSKGIARIAENREDTINGCPYQSSLQS